MTKRLAGKVIAITDGTSGLGQSTAEMFVGHGVPVIIVARSVEKSESIARELGDNALLIQTDVTTEGEVKYSHGRNSWNIVA